MIPLGRLVDINPDVEGFEADPDRLVTFMPLEAVWPDGRADTAARRTAGSVASGYTRFQSGDILLPKITPTFEAGRVFPVDLDTGIAAGTTELHVLRPKGGTDARFVAYVCRSQPFLQDGATRLQGVGNLRRVPTDFVARFPVHVSRESEQRAIADYLDRETAQIDELIAKQEKLIEVLRERRSAVCDSIVWSGLESVDLRCADDGQLPSSPESWRRVRNKALLYEVIDVTASGDEELLSVSHLSGVTPRSEKSVTMTEAESLVGYREVQGGDLVINTMWAWMGALGVSPLAGIVSPAYGVYRPRTPDEFEPRFFHYLYRSSPYVAEMTRYSRGIWSSRLRIYPEVFLRLAVVVPPLVEQRRIADYLDDQVAAIDLLIAKAERFIQLSKERRAALITAAVTGQIDVRGESA